MKTVSVDDGLDAALEVLKQPGGVLLVPTETVYGLVCDWEDSAARKKIYELKHRAENKLLAAFVSEWQCLPQEILPLPENAVKIARAFCPGPVTIVVPDRQGSTFGFRIPDHPFILKLLRVYGKALASTSANLSGEKPALCVKEALQSLSGEVTLAVDGDELPAQSLASTVVMVKEDSSWSILRQGPVTASEIEKVCCGAYAK